MNNFINAMSDLQKLANKKESVSMVIGDKMLTNEYAAVGEQEAYMSNKSLAFENREKAYQVEKAIENNLEQLLKLFKK